MRVKMSLSADGQVLYVTHTGVCERTTLCDLDNVEKKINFEKKANPLMERSTKSLVDFSKADFIETSLMQVDGVASSIRSIFPLLKTMAIVHPSSMAGGYFSHAENVCNVTGIKTKVFDDVVEAKRWLGLSN